MHDGLVAELLLDLLDALNISIGDLTVLGAIAILDELAPLDTVELHVELNYQQGMDHVYEGEAHVLMGPQIFWHVKIVIFTFEFLVDEAKDVGLSELYWDVPDHQSGLPHDFGVLADESLDLYLLVLGAL